MNEKIIFAGCILVTVIIELIILYQFMEGRYKRSFRNNIQYMIAWGIAGVLVLSVNLMNIPIANFAIWIITTAIMVSVFYYHEGKTIWMCALESEIVIFVFIACESVGSIGLKLILFTLQIKNIDGMMMTGLMAVFSNVVAIFFWYVFAIRIWKKECNVRYTTSQYLTHIVIALYSIANIIVITYAIPRITTSNERNLLFINMLCIVFADMYFLYFINCIAEKNQLQIEKELLEQQSELQYKHYQIESEKYNQSMQVLHDVNRHLKMVSKLQIGNKPEQAELYAEQIAQMLKKIVPEQYTEQPIVNILLLEKKRQAEKENIEFHVEVGQIDLSFMDTIDITTIFSNILDNAFEATGKVNKNRFIDVKIQPYCEFIVIRIENSMEEISDYLNGRPKTRKSGNHGYGLLNVEKTVKKYDGNVQYEVKENRFIIKIIMSQ